MASGSPTTMPAKMISDMPLPMPRSLICSPSHMMKAVPVVSEMMVIRMNPKPGLMTIPSCMACRPVAMPKDCMMAEHDGQVAGPLGDLAAAQFAFLLQFLERGHHHRQQLQDDRRRDVRHDAQGENVRRRMLPPANMSKNPKMPPDIAASGSPPTGRRRYRAWECVRPGGTPPATRA